MGPISAIILNDGNFTRYMHDEALTIQLLATVTIDGEYAQHTDIGIFCNIVSNCNWMKVAFENTNFTDTTIKVQNKMLKVHKVVLASASEAFQKMFVDSSIVANRPDLVGTLTILTPLSRVPPDCTNCPDKLLFG